MACLPESLKGKTYYQPTQQGAEAAVAEKLEYIKSWRNK